MAGGNLIYVGQSGVVLGGGWPVKRALSVPEDVCMEWVGGRGSS